MKMQMKLFVAVLGVVSALPAHAVVTTFASRATFLAAAGPVIDETFNGFAADVSFNLAPFDAGLFTLGVIGPGVPTNRNKIDVVPDSGETDVDGTANLNLRSDAQNVVTISFDSLISGFGGDFVNFSDSSAGDSTVSLFSGVDLVGSFSISEVNAFLGFTSDLAFDEIRFSSGANDVFGLDNIAFAAIPEPSVWAAMIAGFGMVGAAARRRRRIQFA